ncbi:MAG: hypothetical protein O2798_01985 [Chloroflexi bacterium]|nr:hypothetical protein [Chloroflexota bacterium]MDA1239591.1 hypothetical protein [Chloroflexota bacterium]
MPESPDAIDARSRATAAVVASPGTTWPPRRTRRDHLIATAISAALFIVAIAIYWLRLGGWVHGGAISLALVAGLITANEALAALTYPARPEDESPDPE